MAFLADEEIRQWFANAAPVYHKVYGADYDVFNGNGGQYTINTILHHDPTNLVIKGSEFQEEGFSGELTPFYILEYQGSGEMGVMDMLQAHDEMQTEEEYQVQVQQLRGGKADPVTPLIKSHSVLILGLSQFLVDRIYKPETWPVNVRVDILQDDNYQDFSEPILKRRFDDYDCVIFDDSLRNEDLFSLAKPLLSYFQAGGMVIFVACMGTFAFPKTLSDVFGCDWKLVRCDIPDSGFLMFSESGKNIFSRLERGHEPIEICNKVHYLSVLPEHEAMLIDAPKDSPYSNSSDEEFKGNDDCAIDYRTPFALHRTEVEGGGTGWLAYFGDSSLVAEEHQILHSLIVDHACEMHKPLDLKTICVRQLHSDGERNVAGGERDPHLIAANAVAQKHEKGKPMSMSDSNQKDPGVSSLQESRKGSRHRPNRRWRRKKGGNAGIGSKEGTQTEVGGEQGKPLPAAGTPRPPAAAEAPGQVPPPPSAAVAARAAPAPATPAATKKACQHCGLEGHRPRRCHLRLVGLPPLRELLEVPGVVLNPPPPPPSPPAVASDAAVAARRQAAARRRQRWPQRRVEEGN